MRSKTSPASVESWLEQRQRVQTSRSRRRFFQRAKQRQVYSDWVGARLPDNEPLAETRVAEVVQRLLGKVGVGQKLQEAMLVKNWEDILGPVLASHCKPGAIRRDVLQIRVDHSTWLHQLSFAYKGEILKKIQQACPVLGIKDLNFRIG